jgi:hydrogenase nickel incorporation protein HypA/HybF
MHEVGVMQQALALALNQATSAGATRIHVLRLKVGRLSGVVPEALEFAFQVLRENTLAAGATLEIVNVPVVGLCERCDREFAVDDLVWECPQCGTLSAKLKHGLELEVDSLEIS